MEMPIAVLTRDDDPNRFHTYIEEVLLTEGYPWFRRVDLAHTSLTPEMLAGADVTILCSIQISSEECTTLLRYVEQGGRLLALRPSQEMAEALGLGPHLRKGALPDRWLQLNPDSPLAQGLAATDLQFHGPADLYTWSGEQEAVVAWLAAFLGEPTCHPAILATTRGQGRIALFTFDLARSTVLFHQGRRENSSLGRGSGSYCPGWDGACRANWLFVDYLDERLKAIPQADVHQDIFVRLLNWLGETRRPLPRLWYFPEGVRAVALFDGDGDYMEARQLRNVIEQVEGFGASFTTYLMLDYYSEVDPDWEAELRARGHGFGTHPIAPPRPSLEEMREILRHDHEAFAERYGHRPVSCRGHSIRWVGWTEHAKFLAENGVRLDTNFGPFWFFREGYLNGSGLPVKFMDEEGRIVDVYEQCTISMDDCALSDKTFLPAYSIEEAIAVSRKQLEDAAGKYHTVYHPLFHPPATDPDRMHTQPWLTAMLWYCRELSVPCVSDEAWVQFNDARRAMRLEGLKYDVAEGRLEFDLRAEQAISGATVALPARWNGRDLVSVLLDGEPVDCKPETLEGLSQVLVSTDFIAEEVRHYAVGWR